MQSKAWLLATLALLLCVRSLWRQFAAAAAAACRCLSAYRAWCLCLVSGDSAVHDAVLA
jgi:hypothetical protein